MINLKLYFKLVRATLVLVVSVGYAQQDPTFNQYMFNTLSYNPAYAGSKDGLAVNALSRFQWVGLNGAPQTYTITAHTPTFSEQIGVGGSIVYDKIGPERRYSFNLDAAYRMQVDFKHMVSFGMKLGAFGNRVDFSELNYRNTQDPFQNVGESSKLSPNIGVGAIFYSEQYYLGVSVPRMLKTSNPNGSDDVEDSKQKQHLFVTAGYVYDLSSSIKFKPTTLLKYVSGSDPQLDITLNFLVNETLWFGGFYRTGKIAGLIVQSQPIKDITFGYSFDYPFSDINSVDGFAGSHELMVGYTFQNKNAGKFKSPRYF